MIRACRSCKHHCTHFTETMVFAMVPQDSQGATTAAFPGSQDLKRHGAWGVFTQLQTIKNAKRQILTSSLTVPAEEYQDGHTKPPTASPRAMWDISYQRRTKAASWVTDPQKQSGHWNKAAVSWPKVRVNIAQVATWINYSVMRSIKPPRPAVIHKVWKKAKSAQISKAAKQVQAWQQAFCSSRPLENIGKGIKQGGKN